MEKQKLSTTYGTTGEEIKIKESISGIKIKDYHDIGINGLVEIIALNIQEAKQVERLGSVIADGDLWIIPTMIKQLLDDINSHTDYCQKCIDDILSEMERSTAEHLELIDKSEDKYVR